VIVNPHIVVSGADRAAGFYREAFGAQEHERIPTPDGRITSVQLRIGKTTLHVADGAQVSQPLGETFWGDLHGQLEDPFGHRWNVSQHLRAVPTDEVVAAAAQLFQ